MRLKARTYKKYLAVHFLRDNYIPKKNRCGEWDSNPRTSTRQGPKPCAFDLAGQPPQKD